MRLPGEAVRRSTKRHVPFSMIAFCYTATRRQNTENECSFLQTDAAFVQGLSIIIYELNMARGISDDQAIKTRDTSPDLLPITGNKKVCYGIIVD